MGGALPIITHGTQGNRGCNDTLAMMSYQHITYAQAGNVVTITVQRPDKLNALSAAVVLELDDAFTRMANDPTVGGHGCELLRTSGNLR